MNNGTLIVTGGSIGIGAAIVRLAAARGWSVAINYNRNAGPARKLETDIRKAGGKALAIAGDMAKEADIVHLFEVAERELGPITALINNAGIIGGMKPVAEASAETIDQVFAVNVRGVFLCCREAIRRLSTKRGGKGGAIVTISSIAATLGGLPNEVHYAASKGAIDSMTIGLAKEVAPEGIRVNAIRPGLIETEIHDVHGGSAFLGNGRSLVPLQRIGTPHEVATAALWLLSAEASYVTGTFINVSGGR